MDEYDKLNIRLVKLNLTRIMESGKITDADMQYDLVHEALRKINLLKDKNTSDKISNYILDQELIRKKMVNEQEDIQKLIEEYNNSLLKKQIEDKQKIIQKLTDEYGDNVQEIYETVKKL